MIIAHQKWIDTDKYLILNLKSPFWSAWDKFNWAEGVEGMSVSLEAVEEAPRLKKRICVHVMKYGTYEITPTKALKHGSKFVARDETILVCIPRTAFTKVKPEVKTWIDEKREEYRQQTIEQAREEFNL